MPQGRRRRTRSEPAEVVTCLTSVEFDLLVDIKGIDKRTEAVNAELDVARGAVASAREDYDEVLEEIAETETYIANQRREVDRLTALIVTHRRNIADGGVTLAAHARISQDRARDLHRAEDNARPVEEKAEELAAQRVALFNKLAAVRGAEAAQVLVDDVERLTREAKRLRGLTERLEQVGILPLSLAQQDPFKMAAQLANKACPICLTDLVPACRPVCPPCGHCLCRPCMKGLLDSTPHHQTTRCPNCREAFTRAKVTYYTPPVDFDETA